MKARAIFVDVHTCTAHNKKNATLSGGAFRFREHVHRGALTHLQGSG